MNINILNDNEEKEKDKNNSINIKNQKYNLNKIRTRFYNDLFLTETQKVNDSKSFSSFYKINNGFININSNKKKKKELNNFNNEKFKKEKLINSPQNKSFLSDIHNFYNINKNDNNINILKYFQEQKQLYKRNDNFTYEINKDSTKSFASIDAKSKNNNFINLIDLKTKNLCVRKDGRKDFMYKLKEFKILEHGNKISKEKNKNLLETYKNNVGYYIDYSKKLRKAANLLNKKFLNKLNDYMRFIYNKIEEEKKKEIKLINKILLLKREIKQLNIITNRKDLEKNQILKWIYFQIQVKEKKLSLPSYYKEIIENKPSTKPKKDEKDSRIQYF